LAGTKGDVFISAARYLKEAPTWTTKKGDGRALGAKRATAPTATSGKTSRPKRRLRKKWGRSSRGNLA